VQGFRWLPQWRRAGRSGAIRRPQVRRRNGPPATPL